MCGCRLHSAPPLAAPPLAPPLPLAATLPAEIRGSREGWAKRVYCKGLVTRCCIFIRFSSLVIICFVKSFHELNIRFFGPAVAPAQLPNEATGTSSPSAPSRPLASHSNISAKVREAGTLPRSPRSSWRAATPEAPQDWPSGTDSMLFFAARARAHATLNRRLALSARIGERWC